MKRHLLIKLVFGIAVLNLGSTAFATCGDTWSGSFETSSGNCAATGAFQPNTLTKTVTWSNIYWLDGYTRTGVVVSDTGQLGAAGFFTHSCTSCWPRFDSPYFEESGQTAYWIQKTYKGTINMDTNACSTNFLPSSDHRQGHTCPTPGHCLGQSDFFSFPSSGCITGLFFQGPCTRSDAFRSKCDEYEDETCSCTGGFMSPIVIDVDRSGFSMTDAAGGVVFNFLNDGVPLAMAWTAPGSSNAFLVLDRNGNGTIDNGEELFGDITPQPASSEPNGFLALAVYDTTAGGGNGNGRIDSDDAVFSQLKLWQDANHNAISEPNELHTPAAVGLNGIDLDYKESKKTDAHGNKFNYRAKVYDVKGGHSGKWAWDVFLKFQ